MRLLITFIFLFWSIVFSQAQDLNKIHSEKNFQYAITLFEQKNYYRSVTEFKRYIFFGKDKIKKDTTKKACERGFLWRKRY